MAFRARPRGIVGQVGKRQQVKIEGFEELTRNLLRLSDQVRVEVLTKAVDEGAEETLDLMQALAPRAPGAGARGYHGADRLRDTKLFSRRDSRARAVGIHGGSDSAWHLMFAEVGTIHSPDQPFMKPTAQAMRKRMVDIIVKHYRLAVRKGIRLTGRRR